MPVPIFSRARLLARLTAPVLALSTLFVASGPSAAAVTPGHRTSAARALVVEHAVFVQLNAERKKFGLGAATLTHAYDSDVIAAAENLRDPSLSIVPRGVVSEDGIWGAVSSSGTLSSASSSAIVQTWVYQDGWQGSVTPNLDCTGPSASGCNGHRRAVLRKPPYPGAKLSMDVASVFTTYRGQPTLSVAAVMAWSLPNTH